MLLISMVYAYKNQAKIQKKIVSLCLLDIQKRFWKTTDPTRGACNWRAKGNLPCEFLGTSGRVLKQRALFFGAFFCLKFFPFFGVDWQTVIFRCRWSIKRRHFDADFVGRSYHSWVPASKLVLSPKICSQFIPEDQHGTWEYTPGRGKTSEPNHYVQLLC